MDFSTSKNLRNVGTYRLVVTDNSGCTDDLEVILTQNNEIKLSNYNRNSLLRLC
jgi:hypothetical protein